MELNMAKNRLKDLRGIEDYNHVSPRPWLLSLFIYWTWLQVEDEDIWDDTALIKAYDEAVTVMKVGICLPVFTDLQLHWLCVYYLDFLWVSTIIESTFYLAVYLFTL